MALPGWTPPAQTRPITPEVYVLLRTYIEAGTTATRQYIENKKAGCENLGDVFEGGVPQTCRPFKTNPDLANMAVVFFEFVPLDLINFSGATNLAQSVMGYSPDHVFEVWEIPGWPAWVDRQQLLDALELVTPAEVRAQVLTDRPPDAAGKLVELPDALTGGLEWWTVALGALGVLAFLGRRTLGGLLISLVPKGTLATIARVMFRALVATGVLTAITWLGKKAVENVTAAASSVLPYIIGGVVVAGLGVAVYFMTRRPGRRLETAA